MRTHLDKQELSALTWYMSLHDFTFDPMRRQGPKTYHFVNHKRGLNISKTIQTIVPLYKAHMSELGKRGGKWKGIKGFAANPKLAREAGKRGGAARAAGRQHEGTPA